MRRNDVAPKLRHLLVPVQGRPHIAAMLPPPVPRALPSGAFSAPLANEAERALGRLQGLTEHWPAYDLLTRTLARREAVQSSQIEGTKTNLGQLLAYEATHSAQGLPADVRVTEQYVHALQLGLDAIRANGRRALNLELIGKLHALLMQHEAVEPKGSFRTEIAWIGAGRIEDASFVPSPPAAINAGMRELETEMLQYHSRQDEIGALSLVAQVAIAHAQFETIHPFTDGNGRVGRLLMPLMLAAGGHPPLYLSGSLMRHRAGYYAALNRVQLQGDWRPWLDMLSRAIIESAGEAVQLAQDLDALVAQWDIVLRDYRRDSVARRLPPLLIGHPVVTASHVAALLAVSHRSALTGIQTLIRENILVEADTRGRGRTYLAHAVLARLNKPPTNDPS